MHVHGLLVAYRPFVDPVSEWSQGAVDWWWATLPVLALLTAIAYKATRMEQLGRYWRAVLIMGAQITVAMLGIGVVIGLIAEVVVPFFLG